MCVTVMINFGSGATHVASYVASTCMYMHIAIKWNKISNVLELIV